MQNADYPDKTTKPTTLATIANQFLKVPKLLKLPLELPHFIQRPKINRGGNPKRKVNKKGGSVYTMKLLGTPYRTLRTKYFNKPQLNGKIYQKGKKRWQILGPKKKLFY